MRYEEKPQITEQEIREAMDFSTAQVKRNLPEFTTKFQKAYSENGFYAPTDNVDWTTGFWTGEIWLSYEDTGKDIYKKAGEIQIDSFLNRIENKIEVDHHDMGFLYSPSCVAGYKLTGNETGRKAAILGSRSAHPQISPGGQFYTGVGCDGCTGKLPADHRLSFKSAAALLGVGGDRRSEVSGHCGEAYSHGGRQW